MPPESQVTVVIPCYNCALTIRRAFASVIAQTRLPNQIIFVNDCSTDNTLSVLQTLVAPRKVDITIINLQTNGGPANARNIGIDTSNNDLIAFLDADDTWHSMKLQIQMHFMDENPTCLLSGHRVLYRKEYSHTPVKEVFSCYEITLRRLIFKNYFNTPSVLLRRGSLRFPSDFRYAEDYCFWLSLANDGGQLFFIDSPLGYVHKPFYGHSGLSSSLHLMHKYEMLALSKFRNSMSINRGYFVLSIWFAKIKYLLRIIKSIIRKF